MVCHHIHWGIIPIPFPVFDIKWLIKVKVCVLVLSFLRGLPSYSGTLIIVSQWFIVLILCLTKVATVWSVCVPGEQFWNFHKKICRCRIILSIQLSIVPISLDFKQLHHVFAPALLDCSYCFARCKLPKSGVIPRSAFDSLRK